MKISDIKLYPVWVGHRNQMVGKVETDAGLYGYGEAGLSGRELAVVGAVKHYREFLIGRDSMQIGALSAAVPYSVVTRAVRQWGPGFVAM